MKRSVWKGPFLDLALFKQVKNSKFVRTRSRASTILPFMLGKTIGVYNGKKYISVKITEEMLGFKLGEFIMTRLRHVYKKNKTKGKKK
jgi:small subunit ribosomal protein S19